MKSILVSIHDGGNQHTAGDDAQQHTPDEPVEPQLQPLPVEDEQAKSMGNPYAGQDEHRAVDERLQGNALAVHVAHQGTEQPESHPAADLAPPVICAHPPEHPLFFSKVGFSAQACYPFLTSGKF